MARSPISGSGRWRCPRSVPEAFCHADTSAGRTADTGFLISRFCRARQLRWCSEMRVRPVDGKGTVGLPERTDGIPTAVRDGRLQMTGARDRQIRQNRTYIRGQSGFPAGQALLHRSSGAMRPAETVTWIPAQLGTQNTDNCCLKVDTIGNAIGLIPTIDCSGFGISGF